MVDIKNLKIKSFFPPFLFTTETRKYIVVPMSNEYPDDIEIPLNSTLTLEELRTKHWEQISNVGDSTTSKDIVEKVKSARTGEIYTVSCINGQWNCTCPGFGFRHICKHIDHVKQKQTK
jgi:hypothetical protein